MSKIKNIASGMRFPYNALELLKPSNWWYEFKYDRQRKKRGWSDKDTWGGGEYVAQVLVDIINHINAKGHVDLELTWKHFELGTDEFKTVKSAVKAVQAYLDKENGNDPVHQRLTDAWHKEFRGIAHINEKGSAKERAAFKKMIDREKRLYDKATRATELLGKNIFMFWD